MSHVSLSTKKVFPCVHSSWSVALLCRMIIKASLSRLETFPVTLGTENVTFAVGPSDLEGRGVDMAPVIIETAHL